MAFQLLARARTPLDWAALHRAVAPLRRQVEFVPIPASPDSFDDALGVSLPRKSANAEAWPELRALVVLLKTSFNLEVINLYTGEPVRDVDSLREYLG